jgi:hypothetical protein
MLAESSLQKPGDLRTAPLKVWSPSLAFAEVEGIRPFVKVVKRASSSVSTKPISNQTVKIGDRGGN